jgi:hypothetical protein
VYLIEAIDDAWAAPMDDDTLPRQGIFVVWRFYIYIEEHAFAAAEELNTTMSIDLAAEDEMCILVAAMHVHQCGVACPYKGSDLRTWTIERVIEQISEERKAKRLRADNEELNMNTHHVCW